MRVWYNIAACHLATHADNVCCSATAAEADAAAALECDALMMVLCVGHACVMTPFATLGSKQLIPVLCFRLQLHTPPSFLPCCHLLQTFDGCESSLIDHQSKNPFVFFFDSDSSPHHSKRFVVSVSNLY